jgi:hypothetical protein
VIWGPGTKLRIFKFGILRAPSRQILNFEGLVLVLVIWSRKIQVHIQINRFIRVPPIELSNEKGKNQSFESNDSDKKHSFQIGILLKMKMYKMRQIG